MLRVKPGEGNNLMRKYVIPNIRLGATSFLLHETYVPAVRFAAERCDDVSLLLVEPGERNEYLATPGEIVEIGRIIAGERATLHVHLPTDADFDTWEGARSMIGKIRTHRPARSAQLRAPCGFPLAAWDRGGTFRRTAGVDRRSPAGNRGVSARAGTPRRGKP